MKRLITLLIMIALALFSLKCSINISIPKSLKNSFTYCYNDKYTGIDTLINIGGYYKEMLIHKDHPFLDTCFHYFMFYDNGLFVYSIREIYYDDDKKEWIKKDVDSFLKNFAENAKSPGANYFYDNNWGSYIICQDTIKVQKFYKGGSFNDGWHGTETWFTILDKNTILQINSFNLPTDIVTVHKPTEKIIYPANFVLIPAKPKPNKSWILKEKWFWCNEEDWKSYMDRIKTKE